MALRCNKRNLFTLVDKAMLADLKYHRTRKQIWEEFTKLLKEGKEENKDETYVMDFAFFNSFKSALTARSSDLSDDKKLALETALQTIMGDLLADGLADDDDDEGDERPPPAPKAPAPKAAAEE